MFLSSVPALDRCQIVDRDLFDPLLMLTYKKLPRLPRYRECEGLPWGFPGQPAPAPVETRTRSHGCGFWRVRVKGLLQYCDILSRHGKIQMFRVIVEYLRQFLPDFCINRLVGFGLKIRIDRYIVCHKEINFGWHFEKTNINLLHNSQPLLTHIFDIIW